MVQWQLAVQSVLPGDIIKGSLDFADDGCLSRCTLNVLLM